MQDPLKRLKLLLQNIQRLRRGNHRLRWALQEAFTDPEILWLYANRQERMDANSDLFDSGRADFHKDRYIFGSNFIKDRTILDAACGTGYGSAIMVEAGARAITGIDLDSTTVQYAQKRFVHEKVKFFQGDVTNLPLQSNSYDVIVSFETIEHLDDDQKVILEFSRVLKKNGLLIISTPNEWPLEIAQCHRQVYNRDRFSKLISSHFIISKFMNQNSGTSFKYNHGQPRGIIRTNSENYHLAECFIVLAIKP